MDRKGLLPICLIIAIAIVSVSLGNYCPEQCECDVYKNLNRADCSHQKLINADIQLPRIVEILNFDSNSITVLDNKCFENYSFLLELSLSHNSIHTIYLDAFSSLKSVIFIDLSYNRLESFNERIFEANSKLTKLNLSGNKFMFLQNRPFIISDTITFLNLRNSQITHIYPLMFTRVPSVVQLDLSQNLMITLNPTSLDNLKQLNLINLLDNRWKCDQNLENLWRNAKNQGLQIELNVCKFDVERKIVKKFERMMMTPKETTPKPIERLNTDSVWKNPKIFSALSNENDCHMDDIHSLCDLYQSCVDNYTNLEKLHRISDLQNGHCFEEILIAFIYGLMVGIFMVVTLLACYSILKQCSEGKKQRRLHTSENQLNNTICDFTINSLPSPTLQAPPPRRRSPPNRCRTLNQSVSSSNQGRSDFATFIASLFERPSRHRYYRTINQGTANIIRRISRSNLHIASRLSQHFGDGNGNRTATSRREGADTEQLINGQNEAENSFITSLEGSEERPTLVRSETPPPSYVEVVSQTDDPHTQQQRHSI